MWPNYPGGELQAPPLDTANARAVGRPRDGRHGPQEWISAGDTQLDGPYSRTYSDVNDDNTPNAGETVPRTGGGDFDHPFTQFDEPPNTADENWDDACIFSDSIEPAWPDPLSPGVLCSWDPTDPASWQANRAQNGVQAFYLVNVFRDHLAGPAIGFTDDTDGFGGGGTGEQDDPVLTETDDGAATAPATAARTATTSTTPTCRRRPTALSPRMQMYLFGFDPDPDAFFTFRNMNGGDDAGTVWHEYTHGLSNRLVVNDDGSGALSAPHGGAMGEAWSDWYALDLLHRDGLQIDNPDVVGEVDIGLSTDARFTSTRFEPIDCPPTTTSPHCPGGIATGVGGYTFGDFGKVAGAPEVHSDGEIWMQTLWDLRSTLSRSSASRTAPTSPSSWSPRACGCRPPSPPSSTCATRSSRRRTRSTRTCATPLGRVRRARHGLLRRGRRRERHDAAGGLQHPAGRGRPDGHRLRHGHVGRHRAAALRRVRRLRRPHHRPDVPDYLATESGDDGTYTLDAPTGRYGSLNFVGSAGFDLVSVPDFVVRAGRHRHTTPRCAATGRRAKGGAEVVKDDTSTTTRAAPSAAGSIS